MQCQSALHARLAVTGQSIACMIFTDLDRKCILYLTVFQGQRVIASSIKNYLRPSTIMGRKSTFSSAFASALAPYDTYNPAAVSEAIRDLGQDPNAELECVYCGAKAATWDHVFSRVVNGDFSGHGHRIRNLVPSCRTCNESKGKKPWREFLETRNPPDKDVRINRMERFLGNTEVAGLVETPFRFL